MKKHVFFLIRYSVYNVSQGAWAIGSNIDSAEYRSRLYDDVRMQLHEKLFRTVTLPSLDAIYRDNKMSAIVFIANEMPKVYEQNLKSIVGERPWVKIVKTRSHKALNRQMEQRVTAEVNKIDDDVCYATVRLDDDDAVSVNFLEKLYAYIDPAMSGFCVTFPVGILAGYQKNCFFDFYKHRQINNAQGLAFIRFCHAGSDIQQPMTVFGTGNHNSVDKRFPTIVDSSDIMYLRTEHAESDLIRHAGRKREKKDSDRIDLEEEAFRDIEKRFPFLSLSVSWE